MFSEIVLNIQPLERRMALLEDHQLVELFVEKEKDTHLIGNIYKGIVADVVPGLGAAFIDIGLDRTAFLHYSDLAELFDGDDDDDEETIKFLAGDSDKITDYLEKGQEVLVQVQKGPVGSKGARLIGQISIPGKFLVFFPNRDKIGISRKIRHGKEKARIRAILDKIRDPNVGLIVRTEAEGYSEEDFVEEYNTLYQTWKFLEKKINSSKAPCCIFDENDFVSRIVRDLFSSKIDRLVVDDKGFYQQISQRLAEYNPALSSRCEYYSEDTPIFDAFNIEKEIERIFHSRVYLPCGGNIVIEQTEAMVVIDINTGSFTDTKHFQETIKKTNLEAAKEIARQIRLRNFGGIIIVDFIDMRGERNKREVFEQLKQALKRDSAKNKAYPFGPLGLIQITRKRTHSTLMQTYYEHCPYCHGTGKIMSRESVLFKINRWLQRAEYFMQNQRLEIYVNPEVKRIYEQNPMILSGTSNKFTLREDASIHQDMYKIYQGNEKKDVTNKFNT